MNPERVTAILCSVKGVDMIRAGKATGERFTAAEAAMACSLYVTGTGRVVRLERPAELAFRYRWGRDDSVRGELKGYLLQEAVDLKAVEQWPATVARLDKATGELAQAKFLEDLVDLVLLDEHHWWFLDQAIVMEGEPIPLRVVVMRVRPRVWERQLSRLYSALQQFLNIWCGDAHGHIARKLRDAG